MTDDTEAIKQRIDARLSGLPAELALVARAASPYLHHRCAMASDQAEARIGHSPWLGALSYAFRVYPALEATSLQKYELRFGIVVPSIWRPVLLGANGLDAFGLIFFGVPASMLAEPPLLNRAVIQCLDIGLANTEWNREYRVNRKCFHVGFRDYSDTEIVGYLLTDKGTLVGICKNGRQTGEWAQISQLLTDEIKAAEKMFLSSAPQDWHRSR